MSRKQIKGGKSAPTEPVQTSSGDSFSDLQLDHFTSEAIAEDFKYSRMTDVQRRSIPAVLAGRDVLVQAKTGSGKTLAFAVPTVSLLIKAKFLGRNGTGAIVIAPTRELAAQIYDVFRRLMRRTAGSHKVALVHGGTAVKPEQEALVNGANVVVGTPGRLLAHLKAAQHIGWNVGGCLMVVLDEADKLLQSGFDSELRAIFDLLPSQRQTCLFSATQSDALDSLAKVAFVTEPLMIEAKGLFASDKEGAAAEEKEQLRQDAAGLTHGYVEVVPETKFPLLYTFLRMTSSNKAIIFVASCNEAKFIGELLGYLGIKGVHVIHGKVPQQKRSQHLAAFRRADSGLLVATDVAARGLDIPAVDWIVQYDAPGDVVEYVHRVGRTARAGRSGHGLLFLFPHELQYLKYLRSKMPSIEKFAFDEAAISPKIQTRFEALVQSNYYMRQSAEDGYRGFLASYASHTLKDCFNVGAIDFKRMGLAFGLQNPPPPPGIVLEVARRSGKRSKKEEAVVRIADGRLPGDPEDPHGAQTGARGDSSASGRSSSSSASSSSNSSRRSSSSSSTTSRRSSSSSSSSSSSTGSDTGPRAPPAKRRPTASQSD